MRKWGLWLRRTSSCPRRWLGPGIGGCTQLSNLFAQRLTVARRGGLLAQVVDWGGVGVLGVLERTRRSRPPLARGSRGRLLRCRARARGPRPHPLGEHVALALLASGRGPVTRLHWW